MPHTMSVRSAEIPEVGIARLATSEQQFMQDVAHDVYAQVDPYDHYTALRTFAETGREISSQVPQLQEALARLATHESFKTFVLEFDAPDDSLLPPTPQRYLAPSENPVLPPAAVRGLVLGMMETSPFGYTSQQPGNIINNVIAIKKQTQNRIIGASANASDRLDLHTEDASYNLVGGVLPGGSTLPEGTDISPDWLTIQFLRNPDGVPTFVSAPNLTNLSRTSRDMLEQPYFHNATNPGQQEDGDNDVNVSLSVLYNNTFMRANMAGLQPIEGAPAAAQQALKELSQLMVQSSVNLPSKPGNIILIDNRRVAHGRAKPLAHQLPRWDGHDRWQQRVVAWDNPETRTAYMAGNGIVEPARLLKRVADLAA